MLEYYIQENIMMIVEMTLPNTERATKTLP